MANDFVFNGENRMSESRSYEAAGTTFDYHRIDGIQHSEGVTEWITSVGPVREPVELLVILLNKRLLCCDFNLGFVLW